MNVILINHITLIYKLITNYESELYWQYKRIMANISMGTP